MGKRQSEALSFFAFSQMNGFKITVVILKVNSFTFPFIWPHFPFSGQLLIFYIFMRIFNYFFLLFFICLSLFYRHEANLTNAIALTF
jgi:hypothetical protein